MGKMKNNKCIIYIGDFDFRNENVQSHLVKNNGKMLNNLEYIIAYIGINRNAITFSEVADMFPLDLEGNSYLELPNTLNIMGLFKCKEICRTIISYIDMIQEKYIVEFVISYQAPTYSTILKKVAKWCLKNNAKYIVNCADLPVFDSQPFIKRIVMKINWHYMHKINKKNADGVISVSRYIEDFYKKDGRKSVIIPPLFDESILQQASTECNSIPTFLYAGTPFAVLDHQVSTAGMKDRLDKVIDLFLELSQRNTKYKFIVIGITKYNYLTCVPRHAEKLSCESKIEFWGRLNHFETLLELAKSDFMINYRDKNLMTEAGMSTKVVESVSVGTPVIINQTGDTFDYLDEGVSGFKLSGELYNDIKLLTILCNLNKDERRTLKSKCYEKKTFSIANYSELMGRFLSSLESI